MVGVRRDQLVAALTEGRPGPCLAGVGWFGATADERRRSMPGDDVVTSPLLQLTHGITIDAPPDRVWPWLMQTGQGQAGFYADASWWDRCIDLYYRLLSREQGHPRTRYEQPDSEHLAPQRRDRQVGDLVLDGPPGTACYIVHQVEPYRSVVLFTDTHLPHLLPARLRRRVHGELTDAKELLPLDDGRTRLLRRVRMTSDPWAFRLLTVPVVLIWGEAVTARKSLQGLRRRAEHPATPTIRPPTQDR
jgi:hypothetical protein